MSCYVVVKLYRYYGAGSDGYGFPAALHWYLCYVSYYLSNQFIVNSSSILFNKSWPQTLSLESKRGFWVQQITWLENWGGVYASLSICLIRMSSMPSKRTHWSHSTTSFHASTSGRKSYVCSETQFPAMSGTKSHFSMPRTCALPVIVR